MALEGNLQVLGLTEILRSISGQRKTGILTVQGEHDIIAISFLQGEVVAADALNQTVEEGLGHVLVERGLVTRDRLAALASEGQAGGGRLFELLIQRGLVERPQLLAALRQQTYQLLLQVLRWREGEFKFYGGDEVSYEEGFQGIPVEELLIRSAVDLGDDLLHGAVPAEGDVYHRVEGDGGEAHATLAPEEVGLLQLLDGRTSVADLGRLTGLGEYKTRYIVHRLAQAGLVQPVVQQPHPSASGTPPAAENDAASLFGDLPAEMPAAATARPGVDLRAWFPGTAALLAVLLVGVVLIGWLEPGRVVMLPFPWQEEQRLEHLADRRSAQLARIDRANRTYYLLEGRYPDDLGVLVSLGLLTPGDRLDPSGAPFLYALEEAGYRLQPPGDTEPVLEGITGDFLLDPEMLHGASADQRAPLVLLD